jgi:hypothetical protein
MKLKSMEIQIYIQEDVEPGVSRIFIPSGYEDVYIEVRQDCAYNVDASYIDTSHDSGSDLLDAIKKVEQLKRGSEKYLKKRKKNVLKGYKMKDDGWSF